MPRPAVYIVLLCLFSYFAPAGDLKHDTFDPFYRSSEGAVPEGQAPTVRLRTGHLAADSVSVRTYVLHTGSGATTGPVDIPMSFEQNRTEEGVAYDIWKAKVPTPTEPSIVYYKFLVSQHGQTRFYSDDYLDDYDNLNKDGTGAETSGEPIAAFQITVYDPRFVTPDWLAKATVYQIFPDRFRNGDPTNDPCAPDSTVGCRTFYGQKNGVHVGQWNSLLCDPRNTAGNCSGNFGQVFYGGDLAGIESKLDYLQQLGFDTLYLTPIFTASSNHRYDTDDFLHVDPALGGDAAFASLASATKKRGMHLILDAVFNHASSDSIYFNRFARFGPDRGACESLQSPYRTWFRFADTQIPCGKYDGWAGYDSLPALNHNETAVQQFFYGGADSVMSHWYQAGASGWRFDVAGDANFPHSWWVATRSAAKAHAPDGPLIGELWPNASAWLAGDQLDGAMNYRFRRNVLGFARGEYAWVDENDNGSHPIVPLKPSEFDRASRALRDDYPPQATRAMLNLIDSHDTNRALYVLTELGDHGLQEAKKRLQLAAILQFTSAGAPMVFYGDEAAINAPSRANGANGPIGDPYARAPYPWADAGGDPTVYGPVDQSMLQFYTRLAHVRKQHPALVSGAYVKALSGDTQQPDKAPNTYAFVRSSPREAVLVVLNSGAVDNRPAIPVQGVWKDGTVLHNQLDGSSATVRGGAISIVLPALTGAVFTR